ncbi:MULTISPECIES: VENN motif pre-toxin domain-containing protein [Gammaproteobacteria]|uniref:VENN motif pre-toxin domain-containing protein n=2 Tax=Pseudomonadota TaxID=1224 RepID=UPI0018685448|nr:MULTISPECIES: VENN motif pre-toxin domain-containing protein [Gammaproteobacteria]
MGNNIVTAIANGSAPYLANEVKNQIQGNSVESDIQRTIAHGLLNAGLALAKGENAVVQASGAMAGETVGILSHSLYGKTPEELTETEKQNISAWATLTSGVVGGLISDNSAGVANAAQAGKVVVENNAIGAAKPIIKGLEKGYEWCMKNATCRNGLMQLGVNFGLTSAQIQEAMDAGAAARNGDIKAMRNLSPEQVAYIDEQIIHNKGLARLIFGSEPWGGRLGIPSHTGGNQIPDQDRIDTGGNQIPDQGQTDTGGEQISVQIWTDTGGDQIPKPRDNFTETPVPEKPTLDDLAYLDKITQGEHAGIRNKEGRPVGSVINDVQKSRPSDILIQDDGRWVVKGNDGRIHLIEPDGEVVTSFKNSDKNTAQRIRDGRWNRPSNEKLDEFKEKFSDYVRW